MVGADASPTWSSHTEGSKSAIRVLQKRGREKENRRTGSPEEKGICETPRGVVKGWGAHEGQGQVQDQSEDVLAKC